MRCQGPTHGRRELSLQTVLKPPHECCGLHVYTYTYEIKKLKGNQSQIWWCMPLFPALRKQKEVDLCELAAGLVYIISFRPTRKAENRTKKKMWHNPTIPALPKQEDHKDSSG